MKNKHQGDRYFSTSNLRWFNVNDYLSSGKVEFFLKKEKDKCWHAWSNFHRQSPVESTLRFSYPWGQSIHQCQLYVIPRRCFSEANVGFSTLNARRFNVEIPLSTKTVDYSTSNVRQFQVEFFSRLMSIFRHEIHVDLTLHRRGSFSCTENITFNRRLSSLSTSAKMYKS